MRSQKRGGPPALPPDESAVTYSRLEDAQEPPPLGEELMAGRFDDSERREPVFTAVRVDPPRRREQPRRVDLDEFDDGAIALDPEALGAAMPPPRGPRRKRSRVLSAVLLIGALAVLGGIGVVGATVVKVIYGGPAPIAVQSLPDTTAPDAASPASEATASTADPTAVPVATQTSVLPDSGSAGPGVLAIPSNEAAPIDMTPAAPRSEAALSPVPPPAPELAPAAAPEARPAAKAPESPAARATATTEAPPLPPPAPAQTAPVAAVAATPATGTDAQIDSALSDVDRLLAEKKAAAPATAPAGEATIAPPQSALSPAADQSAALTILPPAATILPPPLPAPVTTGDSAMPVPPADIPDASN